MSYCIDIAIYKVADNQYKWGVLQAFTGLLWSMAQIDNTYIKKNRIHANNKYIIAQLIAQSGSTTVDKLLIVPCDMIIEIISETEWKIWKHTPRTLKDGEYAILDKIIEKELTQ